LSRDRTWAEARDQRSTRPSAITQLREQLLSTTVRRAHGKLPVYQELYRGIDVARVKRVSDLPALPFTDRGMLSVNPRRFVVPGTRPSHLQLTTGTTGEPLLLWRCIEEGVAIGTLFGQDDDPIGPQPLALVVREPHHGTPTGIPVSHFVIEGSIADDVSIMHTLRLLEQRFDMPGLASRVTLVMGTGMALRTLVHYASMRRGALAELPVAAVYSYGDFLPRNVRESLESAWGTRLVDRYSCAEHFGGAGSTAGNDLYQFDPHIVPEVVGIESRVPVETGLGVLVLTSLYPFVQCMPLIRYWTGDLVEVVRNDPESISLLVRLKGRLADAVIAPDSQRVLLSAADVRNALEGLGGLSYWTRRKDLTAPGIDKAIGHPIFRTRLITETTRPRLIVDVAVEPSARPEFAKQAVIAMRKECPELDDALRSEAIVLEVACHRRTDSCGVWSVPSFIWSTA